MTKPQPFLGGILGSVVVKTLGPIILKAGAPILLDVVKSNLPEAVGKVVESIAVKVGVEPTPEAIQAKHAAEPEIVEEAIREVATESPEEWAYYVQADAIRADILARQDQQGGLAAAWKWLWMYLLAVFWSWAIIVQPLVNWFAGADMRLVDLGTLMGLTTIYLGLYMGGHTIKDVATKWTGNPGKTGT